MKVVEAATQAPEAPTDVDAPGTAVAGRPTSGRLRNRMVAIATGPEHAGEPRRRSRRTIRFRLTLLYAALFLLCGALMLTVSYLLVRQSLTNEAGSSNQRVTEVYGYTDQQVRFFTDLKIPPPPTDSDRGRNVQTIGDVIAGVQQGIRDDALHQLLLGSSMALGVMLVLSGIVGWLAAGRALRPVGRLTARAQRLSEDNLNERIALEGPRDELTELADTLDGMLTRLEAAFNAQRRFAANVSHEVRTPLAIMRGEADLALADPDANDRERQLAHAIRDNVDRTEGLLESLLALSRSESAMNESETIDLAELAGDVVGQRVEEANRTGVHVDLELGSATVEGDPWLLERLLANLVDNAITHNVPGGWLDVRVGTDGDRCFIAITNTGDELTEEQVARILQPFRRAAEQRPGYGLGMTIVQSVAKAHGGSVLVEPRPGGGLDVSVELPSSAQPDLS